MNSAKTWLEAAGIVLALWLLIREPAIFVMLVIIGGFIAIKLVLPSRRRRSLISRADFIIWQHADQLARRRAQLVRHDAYGKQILDKWLDEINHFTLHHIRPALTGREQMMLDRQRSSLMPMITADIEKAVSQRPAFVSFSPNFSPSEFEVFCAEQLRRSGWNAQVTQTSRDQGVDVIAEKNNVRVVLQCKLYSNPVGNKAVQEVVAGRAHERAQHGAVVTNSSYTSAAEELAFTNGILLLHYSDLLQLDSLLQRTPDLAAAADAQQ